MHKLRLTILPIAAAALTVAFGYAVPSLAVATTHHHFGPHLLVPGKSVGPVHLGALEANVHLGPTTINGPGSVFYRDYSITVGYLHGRAAGISISELAVDPNALVSPGQYQTHTHPNVAIGVPMGNVSSSYPHAQCAHHVIPQVPPLVTENCLLRSHYGDTFFAGGAVKQGQRIDIAAILVSTAAAGPKAP